MKVVISLKNFMCLLLVFLLQKQIEILHLPSLMLLDLAQKDYDNDIIGWDWDSIISQESMLNSVLYNPFGIISRSYADF